MDKKKVLITGINGFVGSHLADYIIDNNLGDVYGTIRGRTANLENINHLKEKVSLLMCDITDSYSISKVIEDVQPDYIFHLAAQSYVPESWKSPVETMNTNVMGSLNLFEAARKSKVDVKIHVAGSSEEYGLVNEDELPIKETNPLRPLSPYGVSKVAMDLLAFQYHKSYGLKTVITRTFNHTGPRRGEVFVTSNWCKQVAEIEKGKKKPVIYVGNLKAKRDFTDVRDVVKAYWLAIEKCNFGEAYNICSEKTIEMSELLEKILSMSNKKIEVKQDPERMRPSDVLVLLGNCKKFREKTGWKAEIPFEKTLKDLLDYWKEKIS